MQTVPRPRGCSSALELGGGGRRAQAFVSLNWVLSGEPLDLETELGLDFLDYLLVGTSAAPLRKVRAPASHRRPASTAPASMSDTYRLCGARLLLQRSLPRRHDHPSAWQLIECWSRGRSGGEPGAGRECRR